MKRMAILLVGLWLWLPGPAQRYEDFHDGLYDEYFEDVHDDLYRFGFMIDNYAASYTDRFVIETAREYGVPRADLRYYLRRGYAPSDLLFGLELARRSGYRLKHVMDRYYRSRDRNWISVSIALGIGRGSTGFRLIVDRFRHQYRYWNDCYVCRNPLRTGPILRSIRTHGPISDLTHIIMPFPGPFRPPGPHRPAIRLRPLRNALPFRLGPGRTFTAHLAPEHRPDRATLRAPRHRPVLSAAICLSHRNVLRNRKKTPVRKAVPGSSSKSDFEET